MSSFMAWLDSPAGDNTLVLLLIGLLVLFTSLWFVCERE